MASHDSIGDFLTIIRNASRAGKESCSANYSKVREGIANILKEEGYINAVEITGEKVAEKQVKITLRYVDGVPALTEIERISKPGRRLYNEYRDIPRVIGGMGICILTTSKGIMKDSDCRAKKAGGELICKVW